MNIERFREVLAKIEAAPKRWDQEAFMQMSFVTDWRATTPLDSPECGTSHCIGGWAVILDLREKDYTPSRENFYTRPPKEAAAAWLELDEKETELLFFTFDWALRDLRRIASGVPIAHQLKCLKRRIRAHARKAIPQSQGAL